MGKEVNGRKGCSFIPKRHVMPDGLWFRQTASGSTAKSSHVIYHVEVTEAEDGSRHLVGTHPMTANLLARQLLLGGAVCGAVSELAREVTLGGSRFDFVADHADGTQTVIEVGGLWQGGGRRTPLAS